MIFIDRLPRFAAFRLAITESVSRLTRPGSEANITWLLEPTAKRRPAPENRKSLLTELRRAKAAVHSFEGRVRRKVGRDQASDDIFRKYYEKD